MGHHVLFSIGYIQSEFLCRDFSFECLVLQFEASAPTGVALLTLSFSLCRFVWWETPGATCCMTRLRQSGGELITSWVDNRPHPGSPINGQMSEITGSVAMGTQAATRPPEAVGEPGFSLETRWRWFETALRSPGTLLMVSSSGLLRLFWEWLRVMARRGSPPLLLVTGTKEVSHNTTTATKHQR